MIFPLCFQIGLMRFFWRTIVAKPFGFAIDGHTGSPFVLIPDDAHKPRFISAVWFSDVLRIAVRAYYAKIYNPVVRFVAVDVINQPLGPFLVNMEPRESMSLVHAPFNTNRDVSDSFFKAASNVASFDRFAAVNSPNKHARFSVVVKNRSQVEPCEFGVHLRPLVMSVNINTGITGAQA